VRCSSVPTLIELQMACGVDGWLNRHTRESRCQAKLMPGSEKGRGQPTGKGKVPEGTMDNGSGSDFQNTHCKGGRVASKAMDTF
jgi:hypothetical protein